MSFFPGAFRFMLHLALVIGRVAGPIAAGAFILAFGTTANAMLRMQRTGPFPCQRGSFPRRAVA